MKKMLTKVVLLGLISWTSYTIYKTVARNIAANQLKKNGVHIRGIIIDEKNYMGNSPVSQSFSYSYQFIVNGKVFKNDSHDESLKVGDSIDIIYVKEHPDYNKSANSDK